MVCILLYSAVEQERKMISETAHDQAAYMTEDRWGWFVFESVEEVRSFMDKKQMLDMICFDVTVDGGIEVLKQLRMENKKAYILLIASPDISPLVYMKPEIMAASLLLRPFRKEDVHESMEAMIRLLVDEEADEELFVVEDVDGKVRIPMNKILFFESREKKIYVCTEKEEYGFYDTLEKLAQSLPPPFLRCHRGFIVNMEEVRKVIFSENVMLLNNGLEIPLSRSYKSVVREYLK